MVWKFVGRARVTVNWPGGPSLGVHRGFAGLGPQAEVDNGARPGVTTVDQRRIAELEREVRELRRANEILKAASAYFAGNSTRLRASRVH